VVVDAGELRLLEMQGYVERTFRHVAESKALDFAIDMEPHLPRSMHTDAKRLQQVLKNLLSNAFKFTHSGRVSLSVKATRSGWDPANDSLNRAPVVLSFSVSDTGIGIAPDKQQIIFEAFQQADGSTSRKYGGTGLGLAISRELSRLLGGEIRLSSTPGRGSTFTLYLPQTYVPPAKSAAWAPAPAADDAPAAPALPAHARADAGANGSGAVADAGDESPPKLVNEVGDDRDAVHAGDPVLLIVENDLTFARMILEVAREKGFKGLVTSLGAAALAMARDAKPSAVTLDICLPDLDGWRVLGRLKSDLTTRHIPVCVVSTEEARARALELGAVEFVAKPLPSREAIEAFVGGLKAYLDRPERRLVLVDPDPAERERLGRMLELDGVAVARTAGGREALRALADGPVDCLVIKAGVADLPQEELAVGLGPAGRAGRPPVIVYAPGESADAADGVPGPWREAVAFRQARSPERLLDQAALCLHLPADALPADRRKILDDLYRTDKVLEGRKVLIVDDDIRNIFALSSVLEWRNMQIRSAETGRDAIARLRAEPDIDIVLMDIMMPEMDGYETIRAIRQLPRFKGLPIIAVTAKAMKGDREKCIEAGAWDYLSKPVDPEQLLSVMRAWLHR
jgi:CheY-like chemotaxis protein